MLQIQHISKTYRTGELVQRALDDVSLCLRENEFVAILGPSGSGKTTLLNIIGGLDRYDSGVLIINGVSTKKYRDRDWDAYRNHSIGFVFQSYNLIPHQSILSNVELALTISGIRRSERRRRAVKALEQVGLAEQLHKRPNQLSGGQMQRVAIARALVNDPEILLADEPTGALDTETSLQVMDLLREVAKDRLVVMVTHNPELAEQYATRIVQVRDGKIISDSDPYVCETSQPPEHRSLGHASMSFATSIALSFNNLRSKLGRTLLTSFAGSIGIIGIALILSMSSGVDRYIQSIEEDTLKSYPLEITDSSFNMASMYADADPFNLDSDAEVVELPTVTSMLTRVTANDLAALRAYFEEEDRSIYRYVQAIEYDYNLKPRIYKTNGSSFRQVNPDNSFAALGFSSTENMSGFLSAFSSTDTFHAMPADESLFVDQYEVKAGHWPQSYNECVLVLTARGRVTDLALYTMGLKDPKELDEMVQAFAAGENTETTDDDPGEYAYTDFLGIEFRVLHNADNYVYDEDFGVWTDRSGDTAYLRSLLRDAETLTIVGVVQPLDQSASGNLRAGICYPASLTMHLMEYAAESPIVQAQLASPADNIFTGQPFGESTDADAVSLDALFSVDEDAISSLFALDPEDLQLDFGSMDFSGLDLSQVPVDPSAFSFTMPTLSDEDIRALFSGIELQLTEAQMSALFQSLLQGYLDYAQQDPATDISALPDAISSFLQSDMARNTLNEAFSAMLEQAGANVITGEELLAIVETVMAGYPAYLEANGISPEEATPNTLRLYLQSDVAQTLLTQSAETLQAKLAAMLPSSAQFSALADGLYAAYQRYAGENGLPQPERLLTSFSEYLSSDEAQALILDAVSSSIDTSALEERAAAIFTDLGASIGQQLSAMISQAMTQMSSQIAASIRRNMESLAAQMGDSLRSAFTVDPQALAEAFSMNMSVTELRDLFSTLLSGEQSSYAGNLRKLGYADIADPSSISIYPSDFNGKTEVKRILEAYNEMQRAKGNDEGVIIYTDMVDALMHSVTEIVDAISIVLIAFVGISLVVSSIMIGIITYISVLERTKEIGILRAIGASKRNISQVFNAETFLVGLCAGAIGVGVTLLLLVPINLLLNHLTGIPEVQAVLPPVGAVVLVLLSMLLTITAGLIPSKKAAKKDPVAALRSE